MLDFIRGLVGNVGSEFGFILIIAAVVLVIIISALIIGFFLSFFTSLTNHFFKS